MGRASELRDEILDFMNDPEAGSFEELALRVFGHQYAENRPYRAYCELRGATPATVRDWADVPAVPTDAFKAAPLVCGAAAEAEAVFRTSGTTRGAEARGTHHVLDLTLYRAALLHGFRRHLLPDRETIRIVSLVPPPDQLPDSSLSHMMGEVVRELGSPESSWHVSVDGGLDTASLLARLEALEAEGEAVLVAGTSFTFVHLFDHLASIGRRFRLAEGSRVMDTGGFKGRSREVTREELLAAFEDRLGIPRTLAVNEYGMTEMTSQFYDGVAGRAGEEGRFYRAPHWVRTRAHDPESLAPLEAGRTGVLRHWDLGNLNSVMVLQTADLGTPRPGGGFELLGRARGAEARGCSIAMDDLLQAMRRG